MHKFHQQPLDRRKFIAGASKSAIAIALAPILQACSDSNGNRLVETGVHLMGHWHLSQTAPRASRC